ncbi:HEPN domain-containing protein [Nocardia fluminea]|uniref:ApeA N-terminal domain 1-containing protein n=1 Tax=Nocardia fluminea TaxID=134984 RepID=UPI00343B4261
MQSLEASGQFWSSDDDTKRIAGTLSWEPGTRARVELASRLIDELARPLTITDTGELQIAHSGDPARIVADHVPRVILGDTDLGPVTCIDAYLQHPSVNFFDLAKSPLRQVWDPYTLIIGAHLPEGHATEFDGVSVVLDAPGWWSHLPDNGSASDDAGEIVCTRSSDGELRLEFQPSAVLSPRSARNAIQSMVTLAKLALDVNLTPARIQFRKAGTADWLEVKTKIADPTKKASPDPDNSLLPPESITLERLVRWMAIEQVMDGLTAAVADPVKDAAIQIQTLTACSLVEGIHKRITGVDRHYAVRAAELHAIAQRIDSEITTPVDAWDQLVKTARNDLAHHNTVVSPDLQLWNWMIVELSVTWVLRLCLLHHAGFTDEEVRAALVDHDRYRFYRENLKMYVAERTKLASI